MSEPAIRRQPIDLDEFERRLRGAPQNGAPHAGASSRGAPQGGGLQAGYPQAGYPQATYPQAGYPQVDHPQAGVPQLGSPLEQRHASDDPLAALARVVAGKKDPFAQMFSRPALPPQSHAIEPPMRGQQQAPAPGAYGEPDWQQGEQGYGQTPPVGYGAPAQNYGYAESEPHFEDEYPAEEDFAPRVEARPSRRKLVLAGGAAAVILLGIGTTMALRGGPAGSKQPPTILALSGPAKVQPPEASQADGAATASMLDKDNPDRTGPAKVVNRQEDPVDLNQAARQARPGPNSAAPTQAGPLPSASPFGEPKRVHTIAVRPDGTLILPDGARQSAAASPSPVAPPMPAAAMPPSAPSPRAVAAVATPPQPSPASPAAAPSARPPVRMVTTTATTGSTGTTPAAPPALRTQIASAGDSDAGTPVQLGPKPAKVASAAPTATAAPKPEAEAGSWAVQLAAASSETEARDKMGAFAKKFSGQLGGHRLGYKQGESNGKQVWRVRVGGMTQEAAASLCENIKGSGGACFVARN